MVFSEREMTAVFQVANAMIMADERIDDNEIHVMSREALRFGIPLEDLKRLHVNAGNMEAAEALAIIACFDYERKKYVASLLGSILYADGDVDDKELSLWRFISKICRLPQMTVKEAIRNIEKI